MENNEVPHEAANNKLQLVVGVQVRIPDSCRTQALFKVPLNTNQFYIPTNMLAMQFVLHGFSYTACRKK